MQLKYSTAQANSGAGEHAQALQASAKRTTGIYAVAPMKCSLFVPINCSQRWAAVGLLSSTSAT